MQKLVKGLHAFQKGYFARNQQLFESLAREGQNPETLFITCSDSRVMPDLITNAAPGDLFVVRNVGNVVPHPTLPGGTSAAIEYAVCVLGVQNIVVCGHTQCGAVQAILEPARMSELTYVRQWLSQAEAVKRVIDEKYGHLEGEARMTAAVEENVLAQIDNLREYDFVSKRLEAGSLLLSAWVFHLGRGEVFDFDPEVGEFIRVRTA